MDVGRWSPLFVKEVEGEMVALVRGPQNNVDEDHADDLSPQDLNKADTVARHTKAGMFKKLCKIREIKRREEFSQIKMFKGMCKKNLIVAVMSLLNSFWPCPYGKARVPGLIL